MNRLTDIAAMERTAAEAKVALESEMASMLLQKATLASEREALAKETAACMLVTKQAVLDKLAMEAAAVIRAQATVEAEKVEAERLAESLRLVAEASAKRFKELAVETAAKELRMQQEAIAVEHEKTRLLATLAEERAAVARTKAVLAITTAEDIRIRRLVQSEESAARKFAEKMAARREEEKRNSEEAAVEIARLANESAQFQLAQAGIYQKSMEAFTVAQQEQQDKVASEKTRLLAAVAIAVVQLKETEAATAAKLQEVAHLIFYSSPL